MSLEAYMSVDGRAAQVQLIGDLGEDAVPLLRSLLQQAMARSVDRIVLRLGALENICAAGIRCLVAAQQAMPASTDMIFLDVPPGPERKLRLAGLHRTLDVQWVVAPA